jgi:tetratricopeptide (TPR) repeat protein
MIRRSQLLIPMHIILTASIVGCVPLVKRPVEKAVEISEERFVKAFLREGQEQERKGYLVEALERYKLAMTVDPRNQDAIDSRSRVELKLRRSAREHYKAGLKFHNEGKYGRANYQFLIALRLWPDYQEVIDRLTSRSRMQIKRYIVHTIKQGENLSKLAEVYYGDSHKFPIIARFNNLTDATRVHVGQEIKVPEMQGIELLPEEGTIEIEGRTIADSESWHTEGLALEEQLYEEEMEAGLREEEEEVVDQVAIYRDHGVDLFTRGEYEEAIAEFGKVLNIYPEDNVALEYSFKSHFQRGVSLFQEKDYLAAKDRFESCLLYRGDCDECHTYLRRTENLYNEIHYKRGIEYFAREQLIEAIDEWELVRAIDPHYKRVDYLINKARRILRKIGELKQSQEEKE